MHSSKRLRHLLTLFCSVVLGWRTDRKHEDVPEYHGILAAGVPDAGTSARICDEKGNILGRGESGELHLGGLSMITSYLGGEQPEAFYRDSRGSWVRTGDRALMSDAGAVFIIGRIKDIIKKTGISLSPAVIESVLNAIDGVEAAVIGIPDAEYGEVPMTIVKHQPTVDLQGVVLDKLGPDHALQSVVTLADLGLAEFPINQTGKVMKITLRDSVEKSRGGV